MHTYEVTGPLVIFGPQQLLKLSTSQIDARLYCVEAVEDEAEDVVRSTGPIQFKRGEIIQIPEVADELPGVIAQHLTAIEKPKKAAKPRKAAKTDDPPAVDLDALEAAIEQAEAALAAVDPAAAEAVEQAQTAVDEAKAALEAALS